MARILFSHTFIAVLATTAALVVIFAYGVERIGFADARHYLAAASSLVESGIYPRDHSDEVIPSFRAPLYPILISLLWYFAPKSIFIIKVFQAMLFGVTAVVIQKLSFKLTGNPIAAFFSALAFTFNPILIYQVADIQTEPLQTFLIAAGVLMCALVATNEKQQFGFVFFTGTVWGLASLNRPTAVPIGLVLLITASCLNSGFRFQRRLAKLCVVGILGMLITIAPWTLSNYLATKEFILINDAGGSSTWIGNHPELIPIYERDFSSEKEYWNYVNVHVYYDVLLEKKREWQRSRDYDNLPLKERETLWWKDTVANARANKWITVKLWFYKFVGFTKPWLSQGAYPTTIVIASAIFLIPLYLLAAFGAIRTYRESIFSRKIIILILLLFILATAAHVVTVAMIRYRTPYLDPYISLFAGIGVWYLIKRFFSLEGTANGFINHRN